MVIKALIFVLFFFALSVYAQTSVPNGSVSISSSQNSKQTTDELLKHLSAAETYQLSGDLANAFTENHNVIAIGLRRMGNIAIEEGKFQNALKTLTDSRSYTDNASVRTDLAVAYLRLGRTDEALEEARLAVQYDPANTYARYILGNIYFNKEDYKSALPELEKVFIASPDFDSARALGLTYLYLKEAGRAKLLFEEIQSKFKKPSPEFHILIGQAYEQTNYPLEAEREFKRALEVNPKQPKANFFYGYVILQHGGSGRLSEAGDAFAKELLVSPEDYYTNFFSGVVASSENDHAKALGFLQKAVKLRPDTSASYLFLGQSQMELGDLTAAESSFRKSIELSKKETRKDFQSRRAHFLLGRLLIRTGRKEEGEKELKTAQDLQEKSLSAARDEISLILGEVVRRSEPGDGIGVAATTVTLPGERKVELAKAKAYLSFVLAQAFHNLGVIAAQNGDTSSALDNFKSAHFWKPDFEGLDRNWGIVAFRSFQYDKAVEPLERHLKKNPQDALARRMLGASCYFSGNFAKAVAALKPIENDLIADAELAYFYGLSLVQQKRNPEAVPVFTKLSAASQNKPESLFYAAQGFMILGDYEKAGAEFKKVLTLSPSSTKANYFLGQCLIRLNRYDEAERAFAKELELNPTDVLSKYHLALTFIERKIEPERTVELLEGAIRYKYDYADARYQLGKIYLEKGEPQKAIEQLEIAAASDPSKDFIRYQLSIAYRKVSRIEDADRELKRYQELKAANRKNDSPM